MSQLSVFHSLTDKVFGVNEWEVEWGTADHGKEEAGKGKSLGFNLPVGKKQTDKR